MQIAVIKCGGSIINELSDAFFTSIKVLKEEGYGCVIVHGGGPDINEELERMQIEPEFYLGMRKTTAVTLQVVEQILAGKTNRALVTRLEKKGLNAIGINGSDAKCLQAEMIDQENLGLVGDITTVNACLIESLLQQDLIPVLTPLAITDKGEKLNVNADLAAAAVAKALKANQCVYITDVSGIYIDGSLVLALTDNQVSDYIKNGSIYGGMIPKVSSALKAIANGVKSVRIVSGKEAFFDREKWYGTEIGTKGVQV
ncbi:MULTISPECIES: acetylglutamate kinase [unclassified Bacillus (in: firmicutes)]|uniref:acetylglutamate kinase n=1 Tax=unclassified Bacillus (in: firmicutes) TaxID=185979 RepID=UPI0008EBAAED|nr:MULTISPECIES: acetylglutamate kinase [unclassified Bacillus (in: firmicutes)]SFA78862.1 N-acetylglutamate kinase [Bacillus sp. UNCCL13]SFQ68790.1 N-acetylglutamate kinase [Bacillus sp. cl95]